MVTSYIVTLLLLGEYIGCTVVFLESLWSCVCMQLIIAQKLKPKMYKDFCAVCTTGNMLIYTTFNVSFTWPVVTILCI